MAEGVKCVLIWTLILLIALPFGFVTIASGLARLRAVDDS